MGDCPDYSTVFKIKIVVLNKTPPVIRKFDRKLALSAAYLTNRFQKWA